LLQGHASCSAQSYDDERPPYRSLASGLHAGHLAEGRRWRVRNDWQWTVARTSSTTLNRLIFALTQHELIEDLHDWLATTLRQTAAHLSVSTQLVGSLYLIVHGLVKLGVVVGVWRGYRWAYPIAIGFLALFIAYQLYRMSYQPLVGLVLLTLFDILIVGLTWREYRQHATIIA
jgi:uncharacterized membrane protein